MFITNISILLIFRFRFTLSHNHNRTNTHVPFKCRVFHSKSHHFNSAAQPPTSPPTIFTILHQLKSFPVGPFNVLSRLCDEELMSVTFRRKPYSDHQIICSMIIDFKHLPAIHFISEIIKSFNFTSFLHSIPIISYIFKHFIQNIHIFNYILAFFRSISLLLLLTFHSIFK